MFTNNRMTFDQYMQRTSVELKVAHVAADKAEKNWQDAMSQAQYLLKQNTAASIKAAVQMFPTILQAAQASRDARADYTLALKGSMTLHHAVFGGMRAEDRARFIGIGGILTR